MQYDFSEVFNENKFTLQEFLDTYTSCIDFVDDGTNRGIHYYTQVFKMFKGAFSEEELTAVFEDLARFNISEDVPYIILSNELFSLENLIIANIGSLKHSSEEILRTLSLFKKINNKIAHIYLIQYIDKLVKVNNIRQSSLSDIIEKKIVIHYESHLIWLNKLALHIKEKKQEDFPELDATVCAFGKWLHSEAKMLISDSTKYATLQTIHQYLHVFAQKIYNILPKDEYHILITYLEKCELISLSIGTELVLIDQIRINQQITKDVLTQALNRNGLANVFEHQYELALATSNSFVLAMCDLDYFKNINDTYGHVAGDKMLRHFVEIVKQNTRNSDIIVRYGGEEFIIILPTLSGDKGLEVLENIRQNFADSRCRVEDVDIKGTVSVGMIEIQPKEHYSENLLEEAILRADKHLYDAKAAGRNLIRSY